jgi:transketolase
MDWLYSLSGFVVGAIVIGRGAPTKQGHHDTHGAPLGTIEVARVRTELDWPHAPFAIPAAVHEAWNARRRGRARGRLEPSLRALPRGLSRARSRAVIGAMEQRPTDAILSSTNGPGSKQMDD